MSETHLAAFRGSVLKELEFQPSRPVRCHLHLRYMFDGGRTLRTHMCEARMLGHSGPKRQVERPSFPSTRRRAMLPWLQAAPLSPSNILPLDPEVAAGSSPTAIKYLAIDSDARIFILVLVKKPSDLPS